MALTGEMNTKACALKGVTIRSFKTCVSTLDFFLIPRKRGAAEAHTEAQPSTAQLLLHSCTTISKKPIKTHLFLTTSPPPISLFNFVLRNIPFFAFLSLPVALSTTHSHPFYTSFW
jgi:hypothetical protein